jgi:phthalate 4,5-dioxygenase oxygenase subunit
MVWTYIGDADKQPPFQKYGWFDAPEENYVVLRINTPVNYLQLYEGGTDSAHVGILHMNMMNPGWKDSAFVDGKTDQDDGKGWGTGADADGPSSSKADMYMTSTVFDATPDLGIEDTPYGFQYAALRDGGPGADGSPTWSVRITPVMLPTGRIIPANAFQFYVFEIPMQDDLTATYLVFHGPDKQDRQLIIDTMGLADPRFWNDNDCNFTASWDDRLGQDRESMAGQNWSGFAGIEQEDAVIAMSMTPIIDRTQEYLVPSDEAVIRLRRRLLESVALNEAGKDPLGLKIEDYSSVAAIPDSVIPQSENWQDLAPGNMGSGRAGKGEAAE